MKTKLFLFAILSVILFSACHKDETVHFLLQVDSVSNITSDSAIAFITYLNYEENINYPNQNWHPILTVSTQPNVSIDLPTKDKIFTTNDKNKKIFEIQLYDLQSNTTYYMVATAVGIDVSNEVSFTTK